MSLIESVISSPSNMPSALRTEALIQTRYAIESLCGKSDVGHLVFPILASTFTKPLGYFSLICAETFLSKVTKCQPPPPAGGLGYSHTLVFILNSFFISSVNGDCIYDSLGLAR